VNQRVKGTEKFWSEEGAEAILQLRADYLSDDQPLEAFWQRRQAEATGQRRYRRVGGAETQENRNHCGGAAGCNFGEAEPRLHRGGAQAGNRR